MTPLAKAHGNDFAGRFREILSDPLNICINRVPTAGQVEGDLVVLHNGHRVPFRGAGSYYGSFSDILIYNRGVHEPLEEFVFQEILKTVPSHPTMMELGSNWAHYSMWLLNQRPAARTIMVEPGEDEREAGSQNFARNGYHGDFIAGSISRNDLTVDWLMQDKGIDHLDILHADIQSAEVDMLDGSVMSLSNRKIDNLLISTHSQALHTACVDRLSKFGYRIEVSSDFENQTTSYDGLIFARRPEIQPVFRDFNPKGRLDIARSGPSDIVQYLQNVMLTIKAG